MVGRAINIIATDQHATHRASCPPLAIPPADASNISGIAVRAPNHPASTSSMNLTNVRPALHRYGVALQFPDFRWVWIGSFGGQSAYWALIVARGVLVLEMTGSSTLVGITTFVAMAPRFIMPPLAGYMADRFDRRTVLASAYMLQVVNVAVMTVLAFAGVLEIWHIVVLALINGSVRTFQMTATQSLIPNLVPREHWLNAISLNQVSLQGARLIGPGLIAPALLFSGTSIAFLLCTGLYLVGVAGVLAIRTRSSGGLESGAGMGASLWEAARYIYFHQRLRMLIILVAFHCAITMSFESMLPVLARDVLGDASASVSYLMMGVGAGALVGVFGIAGVQSESGKGMLLLITGVLSGASMLVLALSSNTVVAMAGTALMGGSQGAFMAISGAMIQSIVPDAMRGRITGLNHINIGGTMAIFNLVNGFAADAFGAQNVIWVLGLSFVAVMAASLALGSLRRIYRGSNAVPMPAT